MTLTEGGNGGKATVFVSISYLFQYDKICKEQNIICSFTHSRVHSHVIVLVNLLPFLNFDCNPDLCAEGLPTVSEGPDALSSSEVDQTRMNDFVFKFLLNIPPTSRSPRALRNTLPQKSTSLARIIAGP